MASRSRTGPSMAQHRRGHSTGSMAPTKARDDGLALFHEMQSRERTNYLHPSMDDIEAALTTKFGGISGYGVGASPPRMKLCSDLLGLENEKNDYDWLLTPPGTPLFPSLDKDVTADPAARSRPTKASRSSSTRSSPRRPTSPSTRKASPSRPSRPSTPTGRPSTPGRSSTPNVRRTLSPSSSFNPSTRSSSPSRKPKTVAHPAMAALSTEQPPNLRTSFPDRPVSNSRGSLKLGASQNSDAGDARGRTKRAVSPNVSRSTSKGSSISSSGHELSGVTQRADRRSVSPVNSQARKTSKVSAGTPFSSRKPFDSSTKHMTESRRPTTSGFRPLMSNSHLASFYTRTSKPIQSATESSINSCSVHGSDEEEVASKSIDSARQAENTPLNADQAVKGIHMGELPLRGHERPPPDVEMQDAEQVSGAFDYPSDTPATVDLRHDAVTSVRTLLQSVIDKALDLASTRDRQRESQAASCQEVTEIAEPRAVTCGVSVAMQPQCFSLLTDPEYSCSSMEVYQFDQELQTTGSEVSLEPVHRAQSHSKDIMAPGTRLVSRESSLNLSGRSDQSKEVPGAKRSSTRPFQYAPTGGPGARHHVTRKKDSRDSNSSLFSIPINFSKGDSISSGRPTSIDDTHSSVDTPRRYLDSCSSSRYMPFEDDTRSEESYVDYYVVQPSNRARRASPQNLGNFVDADDAEGYVDYFVDDYSQKKPQSSSADFTLLGKAIEIFEPADAADADTVQEDEAEETQFEVCGPSADLTVLDVDNELLQDWREEQREVQQMEWEPASCEQLEDGPRAEAHRVPKMEQNSGKSCFLFHSGGDPLFFSARTGIGAYSAESLLFCSSIVHEIVFKAAALGIEKEDLKKLATPASADDLVTFLGLSKSLACGGGSGGSSGTGVQAPPRTTTTTTVRQSLAYLQNQKVMQNTTVSYMQGSLGRVQEDVKAHYVGSRSHPAPSHRKQKSNKCRCTIL